jgi:hypothetical protein
MAGHIYRDQYDPYTPTAISVSYDWRNGKKTADIFAGEGCIEKAASHPDDVNVRKDWPHVSWGVIANEAAGPVTVEQTLQAMLDVLDGEHSDLAGSVSLLYFSAVGIVKSITSGDYDAAWQAMQILEQVWPSGGLALNMKRLMDLRADSETDAKAEPPAEPPAESSAEPTEHTT